MFESAARARLYFSVVLLLVACSCRAVTASPEEQAVGNNPIQWMWNDGGHVRPEDLVATDKRRTLCDVLWEGYSAGNSSDLRAIYFLQVSSMVGWSLPQRSDVNSWARASIRVDGVKREAWVYDSLGRAHDPDSFWIAIVVDPSELGTHREVEFENGGRLLAVKTSFHVGSAEFVRAMARLEEWDRPGTKRD